MYFKGTFFRRNPEKCPFLMKAKTCLRKILRTKVYLMGSIVYKSVLFRDDGDVILGL